MYPDSLKKTWEMYSNIFSLTNISPWHLENNSYFQEEALFFKEDRVNSSETIMFEKHDIIKESWIADGNLPDVFWKQQEDYKKAISKIRQNKTGYFLNSTESLVVCTKNDFELALVLKKKEQNEKLLLEEIKNRIKEKTEIITYGLEHSVCFVGHSQLDYWEIGSLCGMPVRNCAVRGISSFQYQELILKEELLNCNSDIFMVMHGTNDIVYDYSIDQIVKSILESVFYLQKHNPKAIISFVSCLHTNGRADRSNKKIDQLNTALKPKLESCGVWWIDTVKMDDLFGNLKLEYTKDGLHLSEKGYDVFQILIEQEIEKAKSFHSNKF